MTSKKKNRKNVIQILVIILIIVIILMITLIYMYSSNDLNKAEEKLEYILNDEWNDEIYPDGMPALFRSYSGELTAQNIGKSFYYVATELIPNYYEEFKNLNESEISKYYKKNANAISVDLGISKQEDFTNLIAEIKNRITTETAEFEQFEIEESSINQEQDYTEAILNIIYKDARRIRLKVTIQNSKSSEISSIKYSIE